MRDAPVAVTGQPPRQDRPAGPVRLEPRLDVVVARVAGAGVQLPVAFAGLRRPAADRAGLRRGADQHRPDRVVDGPVAEAVLLPQVQDGQPGGLVVVAALGHHGRRVVQVQMLLQVRHPVALLAGGERRFASHR
jgi:hypothetical protein